MLFEIFRIINAVGIIRELKNKESSFIILESWKLKADEIFASFCYALFGSVSWAYGVMTSVFNDASFAIN